MKLHYHVGIVVGLTKKVLHSTISEKEAEKKVGSCFIPLEMHYRESV